MEKNYNLGAWFEASRMLYHRLIREGSNPASNNKYIQFRQYFLEAAVPRFLVINRTI